MAHPLAVFLRSSGPGFRQCHLGCNGGHGRWVHDDFARINDFEFAIGLLLPLAAVLVDHGTDRYLCFGEHVWTK